MTLIYFLVPFALLLGGLFLLLFIKSARSGQFDDLETPAHRILNQTGEKTHEAR